MVLHRIVKKECFVVDYLTTHYDFVELQETWMNAVK